MHPVAISTLAAAGSLAAVAAATAYSVSQAQSQVFGRTLVAPPLPTQLALTFDDGPNPHATPQLLDVLARHNARATFFLIGSYVRQQPALTRRIAAAGHVIGNHTMTHPFLPRRSYATILAELTACNHILEDTLGTPVTLFRPPHGGRSPAVFKAARTLNLEVVQWNLIVQDWKPFDAAEITRRLERGIARNQQRGRGTCVVLHDGGQHTPAAPRRPTVQAVEQLLAKLSPAVRFVTPPHWNGSEPSRSRP